MKTFFKDYGKVLRTSGEFLKKHWLGTIVMTIVSYLVMFFVFLPKDLKITFVDWVKNKFKRIDHEEETKEEES